MYEGTCILVARKKSLCTLDEHLISRFRICHLVLIESVFSRLQNTITTDYLLFALDKKTCIALVFRVARIRVLLSRALKSDQISVFTREFCTVYLPYNDVQVYNVSTLIAPNRKNVLFRLGCKQLTILHWNGACNVMIELRQSETLRYCLCQIEGDCQPINSSKSVLQLINKLGIQRFITRERDTKWERSDCSLYHWHRLRFYEIESSSSVLIAQQISCSNRGIIHQTNWILFQYYCRIRKKMAKIEHKRTLSYFVCQKFLRSKPCNFD